MIPTKVTDNEKNNNAKTSMGVDEKKKKRNEKQNKTRKQQQRSTRKKQGKNEMKILDRNSFDEFHGRLVLLENQNHCFHIHQVKSHKSASLNYVRVNTYINNIHAIGVHLAPELYCN